MFAPSHNDPSWHTTASSQWPSPQPDSHVAAIAPSGGVPPCTEHGYDDGSSTHSSVEPTSTNDSQVKVEDTGDLPEPDWPFSASDNDEDPSGSIENPTSLTDQHNLKQRIKRFRLNHHQTRYLMNEFARHPHPDAAQRDKISQEIPGLSARQVQVWFQNRRAKMKRLTDDDRERMMQSRALPEGFDASSALHSGFTRPTQPALRLMTEVSNGTLIGESPFSGATTQESLFADSTLAPSNTNSPFTEYTMTPSSVIHSPCESIISPIESHSIIGSPYGPQESNSGTLHSFERKRSLPFGFHTQPPSPMTKIQHGMTRLRADSLGLPARPSSNMQHSAFRGLRHHSSMVGLSRQPVPQRRPPIQTSVSYGGYNPFAPTPIASDYGAHTAQQPSGLGISMNFNMEVKSIDEIETFQTEQSHPMLQDEGAGFHPPSSNFAPDSSFANGGFQRTDFGDQQPMFQSFEDTYSQNMVQQ